MKILPETIRTNRLILRRPDKRDAENFYAYAGGQTVGPMAGWPPHRNLKDTKQIIAHYAKEGHVLAITEKDRGEMIGTIGFHKDERRPGMDVWQLGYALSPDYWHKGIATEAAQAVIRYGFEENLWRIITAYCYPDNHRSKQLLEHIGFQYEGCLRNSYLLYDGTIHDLDCYSMTIHEYMDRYC